MTQASAALSALADRVWNDLADREAYFALMDGRPIERISSQSWDYACAVRGAAEDRLTDLGALPTEGLDRTERMTAAFLRRYLHNDRDETLTWRTVFPVTPYALPQVSMTLEMLLRPFLFTSVADGERYLDLVRQYAVTVEGMRERLEAQAQEGWRIPRAALPSARQALEGFLASARTHLVPAEQRLSSAGPALRGRIEALAETLIYPALERLIAYLGADYEAAAPDTVGMSQYPGGEEAYRAWVDHYLSYDDDPERIHAIGLEEVAALSEAMAALRSRAFGFDGEETDFHRALHADPRATVTSTEALEAVYRRHMARMEEALPRLFHRGPDAPWDVQRLPAAMEAGLTFGFYRPPQQAGAPGVYYYNGRGVEGRLQLNAAPLMFHELAPGHHFHISQQLFLPGLPKVRQQLFPFSAFSEGWAEYAAGLGEEEGLYDDPYDLYGWLAHQRFIAARLVVDTGLNLYGWGLERGRAWLAANSLEGPDHVESETLRYATGVPGQALTFRMGFRKFRELRGRARQTLGSRFDIRDFHEAILSQGGLPLDALEQNLGEWAREAGHAHV